MNEIEILKHLMKKYGASGATLANDLGYAHASAVTNRLQSKTMTVEKLIELLDALNCKLVIEHTRGDKETFVVTNENRSEPKIYKKNNKKGGEK